MTKQIVIATKNLDKLRELEIAFDGLPVEILSLADIDDFPDAIEDGETFEENAEIKARFFSEKTGLACIADDSGLEVEVLGGRPGIYSARFAGYHAHDVTTGRLRKWKKQELPNPPPIIIVRFVLLILTVQKFAVRESSKAQSKLMLRDTAASATIRIFTLTTIKLWLN